MTTTAEPHPPATATLERAADAKLSDDWVTPLDVRTKSADGDTALHIAALRGDEEAVARLLKSGAFVDEPGAGGRSALYYATLKGHIAIAERLIAAGADPDLRMDLGMSPRSIAHQLEEKRLMGLFEG